MSAITQEAFPPLWRALGLSVIVGYAGLGSMIILSPIKTATMSGLRSPNSNSENDKYVTTTCAWIGARDLSIAVALATFYYQDKPQEMGTLILSGMILCVTDGYFILRHRQDALAAVMGAGIASWGWIGWNLLQL